MKSFSKPRKLKRNGKPTKNYFVKVYDRSTGRDTYVSTGSGNKKAADEWVRTRQLEEAMGPRRRNESNRRELTFAEAHDLWLGDQEARVSDKRYHTIRLMANRFWRPFFGATRLADISTDDVRSYLRQRAKGTVPGARTLRPIATATLNNDLATLKSLLNFAVDEGWIESSPAARVRPFPSQMKRRVRYLTLEEEQRLIDACRDGGAVIVTAKRNVGGPHGGKVTKRGVKFEQSISVPAYLYPITLIALRCGLRKRTILTMEWGHIDWRNKIWRLPAEIMKAGRDFSVPIPDSVVVALREYRDAMGKGSHATERLAKTSTVFGLSPESSFTRSFKSAARRAGLPELSFHDVRRCYVNRCRELGIPVDVAMSLSDHADIGTFLKHYREVKESDRAEAVAKLDEPWKEGRHGS